MLILVVIDGLSDRFFKSRSLAFIRPVLLRSSRKVPSSAFGFCRVYIYMGALTFVLACIEQTFHMTKRAE